MSHIRFLKVALPAAAIPAVIILFLPSGISYIYVSAVEPLALIIGSILALYVSSIYRKQLRVAFIFLSVYLFIYTLAIISVPYLQPHLGDNFQVFLLSIQIVNYSMLILFCVNLLMVIDIRRLNGMGWIFFSLVFIICILVAVYPVWPLIKGISNLAFPAILYTLIRIIDAGLVIVLMPVVWLYVQYLKSQQKQSLTFTVIIFGIIWSTIADYIFESVSQIPLRVLTEGSELGVNILDTLYIYGYLIIAVGLYAHHKQDQWGYNIVDKAMAGELNVGGLG